MIVNSNKKKVPQPSN